MPLARDCIFRCEDGRARLSLIKSLLDNPDRTRN